MTNGAPTPPAPPPPSPQSPPLPVSAPASVVAAGGAWKTILGITSSIILIGGAVAGYVYFLREPKPEDVIKRMTQVGVESKSNRQATTVSATLRIPAANAATLRELLPFGSIAPEGGVLTVQVDVKGTGAHEHIEKGESRAWGEGEIAIRASGVAITLGYETRTDRDVTHLKIKELPLLDLIGLGHIKNQWIKIDGRSLYETFARGQTDVPYEKMREEGMKTSEKTRELLKKYTLFTVLEKLPRDTISGMPMYHYKVALNQDELRAFAREMILAAMRSGFGVLPTGVAESEVETKKMRDTLEKQLASFSIKGSGELWIGVRDSQLYKMRFTPEIDAIEVEPGKKMQMTVTFAQEFSEYNAPVTVETPGGAIPIEQLIGPLLQSVGGLQLR